MASSETGKAFVVKKVVPSTASYVLVVDKKFLIANFTPPQNVPQIGAVINIGYRYAEDATVIKVSSKKTLADKIDVTNWGPYNGYSSMMFRLSSRPCDEVLRFTGDFYTCGCVRYKGEPLTNPAIFNDVIGVVEDRRNVMDRKYIGKLLATVTYIENGCEQKWELCYVDKYLKKEKREDDEAGHPPYHGIIGALSEIPKKACYITSRDFPHDVRFFRGTNTVSMDIYSWLGREVFFHARKGVNTPFMSFYVIGSIEPEPKSSAVTIYSTFDKFFSLKLEVEYIGCTDENGLIIVWSDKWEFIADSYSVFKNLEFGIYRVEIVRQYVPNQFPRWKLKKIFDIVESYGSNSGKRPVERPRIHASIQASNERIGNHENKKNDDSGIDAEEEEGGSTSLKGSVGEETPRKRIEVHAQYRDVNDEVEHELQCYMHECLKSVRVRAAIKQADPWLFEELVKAIMRV